MTPESANSDPAGPPTAAQMWDFLAVPLTTYVSWVLIIGIVWVVPAGLYQGDYPLALMAGIAALVSLLPTFLQRSYRVVLPWELEFLIVLQLHLHTFWGVWLRFYDSHWFWDDLLHLKGTLIVSFLGFYAAYALQVGGRIRLSFTLLALFTVVFGNALGAWWEIVEFVVDKTLHKNTQYGLDNTMIDLIHNAIGSLLAAALGWAYVRFTRPEQRLRAALPLGKLIGRIAAAEKQTPES